MEQEGEMFKNEQIERKNEIEKHVEGVRSGQRKNLIKVTKRLTER